MTELRIKCSKYLKINDGYLRDLDDDIRAHNPGWLAGDYARRLYRILYQEDNTNISTDLEKLNSFLEMIDTEVDEITYHMDHMGKFMVCLLGKYLDNPRDVEDIPELYDFDSIAMVLSVYPDIVSWNGPAYYTKYLIDRMRTAVVTLKPDCMMVDNATIYLYDYKDADNSGLLRSLSWIVNHRTHWNTIDAEIISTVMENINRIKFISKFGNDTMVRKFIDNGKLIGMVDDTEPNDTYRLDQLFDFLSKNREFIFMTSGTLSSMIHHE
jgi:uncharacterized protein YkuJ